MENFFSKSSLLFKYDIFFKRILFSDKIFRWQETFYLQNRLEYSEFFPLENFFEKFYDKTFLNFFLLEILFS